jgi:hypothetical protein
MSLRSVPWCTLPDQRGSAKISVPKLRINARRSVHIPDHRKLAVKNALRRCARSRVPARDLLNFSDVPSLAGRCPVSGGVDDGHFGERESERLSGAIAAIGRLTELQAGDGDVLQFERHISLALVRSPSNDLQFSLWNDLPRHSPNEKRGRGGVEDLGEYQVLEVWLASGEPSGWGRRCRVVNSPTERQNIDVTFEMLRSGLTGNSVQLQKDFHAGEREGGSSQCDDDSGQGKRLADETWGYFHRGGF